jgi:hypothetical protein
MLVWLEDQSFTTIRPVAQFRSSVPANRQSPWRGKSKEMRGSGSGLINRRRPLLADSAEKGLVTSSDPRTRDQSHLFYLFNWEERISAGHVAPT